MDQKLTDRQFWADFWESKKGLIFEIDKDYVFGKRLLELTRDRKYTSAVELGGFPGYYSVFLKKHGKLDEVALFDYFIHQPIIDKLAEKNGVQSGDIRIIENDLFNYIPERKYDLVLSFGLIEHFENTRDIISRHLNFLNPGGTVFITLPNFRGINGWVQRNFDPENYEKHNIGSMNLKLLHGIASELGLKDVKTSYHGGFSIWLENKEKQPGFVKGFVKGLWFAGKVWSKMCPFESRVLSPYIVLEGRM